MSAYGTVSVGTSAVPIRLARTLGKGIVVQNVHATQILYVGTDSSVLTTTGIKLAAGADSGQMFAKYSGDLYGIASGAATDVRFFEVF